MEMSSGTAPQSPVQEATLSNRLPGLPSWAFPEFAFMSPF
jgi:hypothetical protein